MLKNYFKIAIAVLKRRKFFTFISLFGISFTLAILIVLTAFIDHLTSNTYPETNRNRTLYIQSVQQKDPDKGFTQKGPGSYYYYDHYVRQLTSVEKIGIVSMFTATNTYINNRKLVLNMKHTNDEFWDIIQFRFLEGKPFSKQQIDRSELVSVISEETRDSYFGKGASAVGKFIETDNVLYRVTGVVEDVPATMLASAADIFVPYTVSKTDYRKQRLNGNYLGLLLASSPADKVKIQAEYQSIVSKIPPENMEFRQINSYADPYLTGFTREFFGGYAGSGTGTFTLVIGIFVLFFMLLPTLNLVNINISRIMERSSEIGVRKAFGASSKTLVYQFITENIILTMIGTILGVALAIGVMYFINNASIIPHLRLSLNYTVLGCAIMLCLVFGLFSGVYPAWKMSRMQVVNALKQK